MFWERYIPQDDYYKQYSAKSKVCECGAKYTSQPTIHAEWCDLYIKDYFETDSERRRGNEKKENETEQQ